MEVQTKAMSRNMIDGKRSWCSVAIAISTCLTAGSAVAQDTEFIVTVGEAKSCGLAVEKADRDKTILYLISSCAEPTVDACNVLLLRHEKGGFRPIRIDVMNMIRTGDNKDNVRVRPGDVVYFPPKPVHGKISPATRDAISLTLRTGDERATTTKNTLWTHLENQIRTSKDKALIADAHLLFVQHHSDSHTRCLHAHAVGQLGGHAKGSIAGMISLLDEKEDVRVVREVVTALGMLGPVARDAIPRLQILRKCDDRQIREQARIAVKSIRASN
jgi:hypothetical protein